MACGQVGTGRGDAECILATTAQMLERVRSDGRVSQCLTKVPIWGWPSSLAWKFGGEPEEGLESGGLMRAVPTKGDSMCTGTRPQ
jgi:hypothetical protein